MLKQVVWLKHLVFFLFNLTFLNVKIKCVFLVAPIFVKNLEPSCAVLNSEYLWPFELKARPEAELKLYKDNKEVKLSERLTISKEENSKSAYNIFFKKIEAADIGQYKILATNKSGSGNSQASLSVSGAPVVIRKPNPEVSVAEKKAIKVEFEINGLPIPEIQW